MSDPNVAYWVVVLMIGMLFFNPFAATKPSTPDDVRLDVAHGPVTAYIPPGVGTKVYAFNSGDDLPPEGSVCDIPYLSLYSKDGARAAKCIDGTWRIFTIPQARTEGDR